VKYINSIINLFCFLFINSIHANNDYSIKGIDTTEFYSSIPVGINNLGQVAGGLIQHQGHPIDQLFFWDPETGLHIADGFQNDNEYKNIENYYLSDTPAAKGWRTHGFKGLSFQYSIQPVKITNQGDVLFNFHVTLRLPEIGYRDIDPAYERQYAVSMVWHSEHGLRVIKEGNKIIDGNDLGQLLLTDNRLLDKEDNARKLRTLSNPIKINNLGEVLGTFEFSASNQQIRTIAVLNSLDELDKIPLKGNSEPICFNDNGQIVGKRSVPNRSDEYFIWNQKEGVVEFIRSAEIQANPKDYPHGVSLVSIQSINNRGDLICTVKDSFANLFQGILVNNHFIEFESILDLNPESDNQWTAVGTLIDLNDSGQVVSSGNVNGLSGTQTLIFTSDL